MAYSSLARSIFLIHILGAKSFSKMDRPLILMITHKGPWLEGNFWGGGAIGEIEQKGRRPRKKGRTRFLHGVRP